MFDINNQQLTDYILIIFQFKVLRILMQSHSHQGCIYLIKNSNIVK